MAALTKSDSLVPIWVWKSASPSLSAMSLSAVSASGMRKQRLGEAHEHDALLRGEVVLAHESIDPAERAVPLANTGHELARILENPHRLGVGQPRALVERGERCGLVGEIGRRERCPGERNIRVAVGEDPAA